jgi:hypothetical protein
MRRINAMIVAAALTLLASCGGSDGGDEATAGAETNDSGMAGLRPEPIGFCLQELPAEFCWRCPIA